MAMNRIQFQPGMSMPEFCRRFGTDAQCAAALEKARWPTGFRCPRCDRAGHCVLPGGSHKLLQCNACRHQTSLIAGSVFHGTKLGLSVWFLAIYLISQAKTGLSALALKRQLTTGSELPDRMVDPSQTDAGDGRTGRPPCAGGAGPDR